MRLLYLTEYFQPPQEGGLMRTWAVSKFLADHGHDVTVVVPAVHHMTGEMPAGFGRRFVKREVVSGVRVAKVRTTAGFRESHLKRLLYYLTTPLAMLAVAWRERPDLVMSSTPPFLLPPGAWAMARLRRVPWVLEVRDAWLDIATAKGLLPRRAVGPLRRFEQAMFRRADHLLAVTPGVKAMVEGRLGGVRQERILLVMNGYEQEVFAAADPRRGSEIARQHSLEGKFVVIYAGTLGLALDGMTLVRAAAELRDLDDVRFVFIGEGEGRAAMRGFAHEQGLRNCLFVPLQPRIDIPAWLSISQVGINSARGGEAMESSLSNKIFDYMGGGLPVVYAGGGDTEALLIASGGGVAVPPGDAAGMAAVIRGWYLDRAESRRVGDRGRRHVIERYSRRALLVPLERLLTGLAGESPGRAGDPESAVVDSPAVATGQRGGPADG